MSDLSADDGVLEFTFSTHRFRWEAPDICHIVYEGILDGPMVASFARRAYPFLAAQPRMFMLIDVSKLGKMTAEGRRLAAENSKGLQMRGIAMVGASPAVRVVAGLVSRAVELVSGNRDNPTRFFETESEARVWISARRDEVSGHASTSSPSAPG